MMKNSFSNLGYTLGGGNLYKQYANNQPPNFSYLPADTGNPASPSNNGNSYYSMPQQPQTGGQNANSGLINFSDMASPTGMTPPAMTYGSQLFTNPPPSVGQQQSNYFATNTANSVMQGQTIQTVGNQQQQQATISVLPPDCNTYFSDQPANAAMGCHVNVGNKDDRPIVYVKPGDQDQSEPTQSGVNAQGDSVMTNPMPSSYYSPAPNAQCLQHGDAFSYNQGQAPSQGQQQPMGQKNYMQVQYPSAVIGSSNASVPQQPVVFQMPGFESQQGQPGAEGHVYQVPGATGQTMNMTSQQNGANPMTQSRPTKKYVPCGSCRACKFAGPKPPVANTRQPYLVRQQKKS